MLGSRLLLAMMTRRVLIAMSLAWSGGVAGLWTGGWLTPEGLEEVCRFIAPAKGDSMHFQGSHRCEVMRQCYSDPSIR